MPWIEKNADMLPGWKAALMNRAGRATLVRFVLSAMPIYLLIAINVPSGSLRQLTKSGKDFFGKGKSKQMGDAV
jgi:hypothetical protein